MKTKKQNGSCLLIYGGGLCDCANEFMRKFMQKLQAAEMFKKHYVGLFSFESLVDPQFIRLWDSNLEETAKKSLGGFFGTNRDVNLVVPELREKAIKNLKDKGIKWVFVAGGDGSARQTAEIADDFHKEGINFCFLMPCTLDGIEGGKSIGLKPAVKVSMEIIKCLASTCLMTREDYKYPILVVELQGRNRDDVLANVLKELDQIVYDYSWTEGKLGLVKPQIYAIPANYEWDKETLKNCVNSTSEPTLVLLSEGATWVDKEGNRQRQRKSDLENIFERKTRSFKVAHLSQVNDFTDAEDKAEILKMIRAGIFMINEQFKKDSSKPFSLVYDEDGMVKVMPIDYYAKLNPRKNQHPTLATDLEELIKKYIAK